MILRCPFCGGTPFLERRARAYVDGKSMRVAYVRCVQCCARSAKVPLSKYGHTSHSLEAENEAIELWNRRVK